MGSDPLEGIASTLKIACPERVRPLFPRAARSAATAQREKLPPVWVGISNGLESFWQMPRRSLVSLNV